MKKTGSCRYCKIPLVERIGKVSSKKYKKMWANYFEKFYHCINCNRYYYYQEDKVPLPKWNSMNKN